VSAIINIFSGSSPGCCPSSTVVSAERFRNDYLPIGHVRTDPILSQSCLSDHVHTFYGPPLLHPAVTFDQLRSSDPTKSSGNVMENLSLYWHPSIYRVEPDGSRTLVSSEMTSVYYEYERGQTRAFPAGFRMIGTEALFAEATCVDDRPCNREPCTATNDFFPVTRCRELEVSMEFPHCWDGDNLDSANQTHISNSLGEGMFGDECPSSHPHVLPRIAFFFRIFNYDGGAYEFSDGTGVFHADYVAGWDETYLQSILDNCAIEDDAEQCSQVPFTYRNGLVYTGNGELYEQQILENAVPEVDTSCITTEVITGVSELPRTTCSGTLISADGICSDGNGQPTSQPVSTPTAQPVSSPTAQPVSSPTVQPVSSPTAQPVSSPTVQPVSSPTTQPVPIPTAQPVANPTAQPVPIPTAQPVTNPTSQPVGGTGCIQEFDRCDTDAGEVCCGEATCIEGFCDYEDDIFCFDPGEGCDVDADCCEGECINDICEIEDDFFCVGLGEEGCEVDEDFCEGECMDGVCDDEPQCAEEGDDCFRNADCCDGYCIAGTCEDEWFCLPVGSECLRNRDCCQRRNKCVEGLCEEKER